MGEAHPCQVCGAVNAPHGIGPPLAEDQAWYCTPHWLLQPSTQALLAERVKDAVATADERQKENW